MTVKLGKMNKPIKHGIEQLTFPPPSGKLKKDVLTCWRNKESFEEFLCCPNC